jgi:DNA gyrase subunit B
LTIKAIHRRSGLARRHVLPGSLFESGDYRRLADVHASLSKQIGEPPFTVTLGEKTRPADSYAAVRRSVLDLAKEGVRLQRFKGLGEMNAEQLRETTMDPASRTLQRVRIEDAAEAERVFSDLMGDKVEPRKEFIQKHAKDVGVLDV